MTEPITKCVLNDYNVVAGRQMIQGKNLKLRLSNSGIQIEKLR
jgi:hypothetical protein